VLIEGESISIQVDKASNSQISTIVPSNISESLLTDVDQLTIVDAFTDTPVSEQQLLVSDNNNLDGLISSLHQAINEGGFDDIGSIVTPEGLSKLIGFLNDGKELPLNPQLGSNLEVVRQALFLQAGASPVLSWGSPVLDSKLPLLAQSGLPDDIALSSLAEALDINEESIKPLTNLSTSDNNASKLLSLDSDILQTNAKDIFSQGVIEKVLDENLLDKGIKETTLTRLNAELASIQTPTNTTSPLFKAQLSLTIPFQQSQWGQAVAERVMWMSSQGIQEAEIYLDPPELGPLQVKVSVANEQAHVSFVVQHGSVREALDQNAMRLREMFEAEGINLADVDVSDQSQQEAEKEPEQYLSQSLVASNEDDALMSETPLISSDNGYSLINTYV